MDAPCDTPHPDPLPPCFLTESCAQSQGKQLDVIIFSCVRSGAPSTFPSASGGSGSGSGSIGFVADVRRMNVAITRAKRALWILGGCQQWGCSGLFAGR